MVKNGWQHPGTEWVLLIKRPAAIFRGIVLPKGRVKIALPSRFILLTLSPNNCGRP